MRYYIFSLVTFLLLSLTSGCTSEPTAKQVDVVRLDQVLADFDSYDAARQYSVFDSLKPEIDAMFTVLGTTYVSVSDLERWSSSDVVRVFQPDVDSVYPDTHSLEQQVGAILARAERDSLQLPRLRFATVTWGNPRPIVRADSVVLIALNHFLGPDYPGYEAWHAYRRTEKSPEQLPYSIAAALAATQYPMLTAQSPTLLSWMLYEGALVEARMRLVPDASAAKALGYTDEQLDFVDRNCRRIWDEMALRKLIYDTDPLTIDRYIAAAPSTPLLQGQTPGRIGRYIGWQIVRAYLKKHPDTSLPHLLSPNFYDSSKTLIESGF